MNDVERFFRSTPERINIRLLHIRNQSKHSQAIIAQEQERLLRYEREKQELLERLESCSFVAVVKSLEL